MPDWLFPVISVIFMLATPFLAWFGSSRYFDGKFEQWRANSEEWRTRTDRRLDNIDQIMQSGASAVLLVRMQRAEQDILDLREYKHEKVEPYIRAMDVLRSDVSRLDRDLTR